METRGISKLDLKRQNRRQILRVIRENGPTSRVDIASQLALTRAAVTIITNEMISQGVLEELGEAPIDYEHLTKGRRKILIGVNANYRFVLGAMINEGTICVGLSTLDGEVLEKEMMVTEETTDQQEIISYIANTCHKMMENSNLSTKQVLGLGIGVVPTRWKQMRAEIRRNKLSFAKLRYMMELELNIPVECGNAICLYAMANLDYKVAGGKNNVLIYSGNNFNAAFITDKEMRGDCEMHSDVISRYIVNQGGRKAEGYPDGSVAAELTASAMKTRIAEVFSEAETPVLYKALDGSMDNYDASKVEYAYDANDAGVKTIVDDMLTMLASLIYNVHIAHNTENVVLQNFHMSKSMKDTLQKAMCALAGKENVPDIIFSSFEGERSFLAGSTLAVDRMFYDMGGLEPSTTV